MEIHDSVEDPSRSGGIGLPDEIDPNWPPPKPKTSAQPEPSPSPPTQTQKPSQTPPSRSTQTPRVPTPPTQQPVPPVAGPPPAHAPASPRLPWQRPGVILAALAAVVLVAALLTISVVTTRSDNDTSAETTTNEVTTSSEVGTSRPPQSRTSAQQPSTSAQAAGPNKTIVDYIKQNGITETPVHRGDPGSPTVNLPFPTGWEDAGNRTPEWAYGAILLTDPAMAQDPPTIIALVSKLTGIVDPAKVLEFAPGELKNLPGYEGAQEGSPSTLGGFDATQIGGTYTKDGVKRAIAQKTVVIPGQDGLYVLQLNADGTEDQMGALMDATSVIDEQTTITL